MFVEAQLRIAGEDFGFDVEAFKKKFLAGIAYRLLRRSGNGDVYLPGDRHESSERVQASESASSPGSGQRDCVRYRIERYPRGHDPRDGGAGLDF